MGAEGRGLNLAPIFASSGIDPTVLNRRGARVGLRAVDRVWSQLASRLDDPLFGLYMIDAIPFGAGDLMDYVIRTSANVGAALQNTLRCAPLLSTADHLQLVVSGNQASMRVHTVRDQPWPIELILSMFAERARGHFGSSWSLKQVSFAHEALGPREAYDRVFQVPVRFGMPFTEAVFERELLDMPMEASDPRLNAILNAQADELLATVPRSTAAAISCRDHRASADQRPEHRRLHAERARGPSGAGRADAAAAAARRGADAPEPGPQAAARDGGAIAGHARHAEPDRAHARLFGHGRVPAGVQGMVRRVTREAAPQAQASAERPRQPAAPTARRETPRAPLVRSRARHRILRAVVHGADAAVRWHHHLDGRRGRAAGAVAHGKRDRVDAAVAAALALRAQLGRPAISRDDDVVFGVSVAAAAAAIGTSAGVLGSSLVTWVMTASARPSVASQLSVTRDTTSAIVNVRRRGWPAAARRCGRPRAPGAR